MNGSKFVIVIVFMFTVCHTAVSNIRLSPYFGASSVMGYFIQQNELDSRVSQSMNNTNLSWHFRGIRFEWDDDKWQCSVGVSEHVIGKRLDVTYDGIGSIGGAGSERNTYGFSLWYARKWQREYSLGNVTSLISSVEEDESRWYLVNFYLAPVVGLDFNIYHLGGDVTNEWEQSYTRNGHFIETSTKSINSFISGANLLLGMRFQFTNAGKDRLALTFWYNQGVIQRGSIIHEVKMDQQLVSQAEIGTRGSSFGVTLSYPITLLRATRDK